MRREDPALSHWPEVSKVCCLARGSNQRGERETATILEYRKKINGELERV